jgi:hypothetical protein
MVKAILRRSIQLGAVIGVASLAGRVILGAGAAASFQPMEGCSVSSTDGGGVIIKTQTKYVGNAITKTSGAWTNRPIVVKNANGSITVSGDPSATAVTAVAKTFAFADGDKPQDGTDANTDVAGTFVIDESNGQITVRCDTATQQHGSAGPGTTGCDFAITVPAGSATAPVQLSAHSNNGDTSVANVYADPATILQSATDNGIATATGITGSARVHSGNGDATGSVAPLKGSQVEVSTDNGTATLSLPKDFATDALTLQASGAGFSVSVAAGFTNGVTGASTSVGTAGTGAASVKVTSAFGDVVLEPR